jgi:GH35 family endo-1,4-beta-xylanase
MAYGAGGQRADLDPARARIRTTGGALEGGGWNLWSDGSVADWFDVGPGREVDITIVAAGQPARDEYPAAVLEVSTPKGDVLMRKQFTAEESTFREYRFRGQVKAPLVKVSVAFTNDLFDEARNEDRNLLLRAIRVEGASLASKAPSGRSAEFAWTQAEIAKHRMGTIVVRARPGATVRVTQLKHEFHFGTAISRKMFRDSTDAAQRRKYLEILAANFNAAVHENAMKWYSTEWAKPGNPKWGDSDRMLSWCEEHGIQMRGHAVFWGIPKYVQDWVKKLDDATLRRTLQRRGREVTARYRGRIFEYDLNNEMIHGDYYASRLGKGITKEMFGWAREGDPDARLYVNDYGIITGGGVGKYVAHIRGLLRQGVPVGGIGVQGHFGKGVNAGHVKRVLEQLAEFNLPIKVTEFDVNTKDEAAKAKAVDALYRVAFAQPMVDGILMWGFWEGAHWRPNAALWKKDFTPTPAVEAYRSLVYDEWWTCFEGTADERGVCEVRAFYGDHRVEAGGQSRDVKLERARGRAEVSVR